MKNILKIAGIGVAVVIVVSYAIAMLGNPPDRGRFFSFVKEGLSWGVLLGGYFWLVNTQ